MEEQLEARLRMMSANQNRRLATDIYRGSMRSQVNIKNYTLTRKVRLTTQVYGIKLAILSEVVDFHLYMYKG